MKILDNGFLEIEKEDKVSYNEAKVVIIPFGLEASVSYGKGTSKGPEAILKASQYIELYDEEFDCEPFKEIGIVCLIPPKIKGTLPDALIQLSNIVSKILEDGKFPLVVGGEHSILAGSIRPFANKYKELTILDFDAHGDLRNGYMGQFYSHASGIRRCLDFSNIKVILCGIRSISKNEVEFYNKNTDKLKIFWAKDKESWNIDKIISSLKGKNVYLTFDIDAFDSSLMPATGTPEPGGLFWDEVLNIIREVSKVANIVGADVNELAPIKHFISCDFLAAKLIYKILSFSFLESVNQSRVSS